MVIVEGPDNAGKSTLVKALCDTFGLVEGKRGTDNRDDLWKVTVADTNRALAEARISAKAQVWDRLFFSEFVYSKYAGRDCEFSDYRRDLILHELTFRKYPIIMCLPPKHLVLNGGDPSRHQMEGVKENLSAIYDDYVSMIDWMPPKTVFYNYATEGFRDGVYETVSQYLKRRMR